MEEIDKLDSELLQVINGYNTPFWDQVMLHVTDRLFWIPFYILLGIFVIVKYKHQSLYILLTIAFLVICADQISSTIIKPLVGRPRPCYEPGLREQLHMVKNCGGVYGFISSHAANGFALATFMALMIRRAYVILIMFSWAFAISYSRMYLGVHYPGDILAGAIFGAALGVLFFRLYFKFLSRVKLNTN